MVMLENAFLGGFVVVGRNRKDGIDATVIERFKLVFEDSRVISSHTKHDGTTTIVGFDYGVDHAALFGFVEGYRFAGGTEGYNHVDSTFGKVIHQKLQSPQIGSSGSVKWRNNGYSGSAEGFQFFHG